MCTVLSIVRKFVEPEYFVEHPKCRRPSEVRDELHPSIPLWYGIVAGGKLSNGLSLVTHDDVIKWKHFPRYWPFLRGIHRPRWIPTQRPVTRSFGVFFDLCLRNGLVNNREAGDLRRYRAHYDVTVMTRDWLKAMRQITIENNYQQTIPRLSVIKYIHYMQFTCNRQWMCKIDITLLETISMYLELFTWKFWKHLCV